MTCLNIIVLGGTYSVRGLESKIGRLDVYRLIRGNFSR